MPVLSNLCVYFLGIRVEPELSLHPDSPIHIHTLALAFIVVHLFIHLSLIAKDEDYKTLVTFRSAACGDHLLFPYFPISPTFAACTSSIVLLVLIDVLACTHCHSHALTASRPPLPNE